MAKIPLRAYIKEIENQIERGEIDQAVTHAKNILKSYPKNIDTYRLLGKAYLESQRFSEAADILQRVLSVIPDDFISQIGMSIIREDEGNLDASIWHMERAYEVQPFNPAVQEELRRLYGRRDGIEPPKIRLTRGALVRMYARGELYTQAVAETRAALAEDPQRMDLLVLLARLYYLSGHKNDAAEVCSELIRKLPYCYEANKLLAEFLPSTNRAEEAQNFLQRIYALDPYVAFLSPTAPNSDQVPDQAVMVEQFTWESAMEESQTPEWTRNVGVAWEESPEEALPDWISTLKPETSTTTEQTPESTGTAEQSMPAGELEGSGLAKDELIPDWMKDAGWIPSDRKADEIMASQPEPEEAEILPADLPDWVQSIAPREAAQEPEEEERTDWLDSILSQPGGETEIVPPPELEKDESQQGLPDWVTGAGTGTQMPTASELPADNLPDWFAQMEEEKQPGEGETLPAGETESAEFEGLPDWSKLGEPAVSEEMPDAGKAPDWLRSFDLPAAEAPDQAEQAANWMQPVEAEPTEKAEQPSGLTDWLKSVEPEATESAEEPGGLSDWLKSEETEATAKAEEAGGLTDWLQSVEPEETEKPDETSGITGWLQSIQPAPTAEPAAEAEIPDWLQSMSEEEANIPLQETPIQEAEAPQEVEASLPEISQLAEAAEPKAVELPVETPPEVSFITPAPEEPAAAGETAVVGAAPEAAPDFADMDAAMAWLESLAAKQGADEATLVTPPEQRLEQPPDWVAREMGTQEPVLPEAEVKLPVEAGEAVAQEQPEGVTEEGAGGLPDWLQTKETESEPAFTSEAPATLEEAPAVPVQPGSALTDWLQTEKPEMPEETNKTAPTAEVDATIQPAASAPDFSDMDAAMAWLESLAAKQGADEATLVTPPEQRLEQPPDWVTKESEGAEPSLPTEEIEAMTPTEELTLPEAASEQEEWLEPEEATTPEEIIESAPAISEQLAQPEAAAPDFSDMDAAMAWLESLAAKQGADEATLVTPPEQRLEKPPDWVTKETESAEPSLPTVEVQIPIPAKEQEQPETAPEQAAEWLEQEKAVTPEEVVETPAAAGEQPAQPEAAAPDFSDMDAAMAWLESLAAKQGADEATLVTPPEQRLEQPPNWVTKEMEAAVLEPEFIQPEAFAPAEAEYPAVEEAPVEAAAENELAPAEDAVLPDWLQDAIKEETLEVGAPEAVSAEEQPEETLIEPAAETTQPAAESAQPVSEAPEAAPGGKMDSDTAFAWLESLAAKQRADEATLVTSPEERLETPPEWVQEQAMEQETVSVAETEVEPAALEQLLVEEPAAEEITPPAEENAPVLEEPAGLPAEAVPDWLSSIGQEEPAEMGVSEETAPWPGETETVPEQPATSEPIPDWLQVPEAAERPVTATTPAETEKIPDWLMGLEEEGEAEAFPKEMDLPPIPGDIRSAWEPEVEMSQPSAGVPEAQAPAASGSLTETQTALSRGELDQALIGYSNLIQNGEYLEETIHDLRDALYRYPVDISIWQTLGDAYARNNQLQEALDAYTKAEELLR
jgi:tetratricopeptide (TPR) repeat protein